MTAELKDKLKSRDFRKSFIRGDSSEKERRRILGLAISAAGKDVEIAVIKQFHEDMLKKSPVEITEHLIGAGILNKQGDLHEDYR